MQRNQPAILRRAHGTGEGALLRAERPPLAEIPLPNEGDTERGLALVAGRGRPFQPGNRAAVGRKPVLASLGVPVEACDVRYRRALSKARRYFDARRRELSVQCGGFLGVGPCALLAHAARATAASVLLYELGGEKLEPALFAQAARLADSARQQEITAVALAEREAAARSKRGTDGSFRDLVAEMAAENAPKDGA